MSNRVRNDKILDSIFRLYDSLDELTLDGNPNVNAANVYKNPLNINDIYDKAESLSHKAAWLHKIDESILTDPSKYHERRDEIFLVIDSLYRDLTPGRGRDFLARAMPHRTSEQIRIMDEAYRKTSPHEGKKLLAKMCPPNV